MSLISTPYKVLDLAKNIIDREIDGLNKLKNNLDEKIADVANLILNCEGRIIITGVGKSGLMGRKIAATFCSLGTPSVFLHPTDAHHGDLGLVCEEDVVIAISYSGESDEIKNLLPILKRRGVNIIPITGNMQSSLAQSSEFSLSINIEREACPLNLAPTTSTTATTVIGDVLAIIVAQMKGINSDKFAENHPSGTLGKRLLLTVNDFMERNLDLINISINNTLKDAIFKMTASRTGAVNVVDKQGKLLGIITDGDIRRQLINDKVDLDINVEGIMIRNCSTILTSTLASEALLTMQQKNLNIAPVVNIDGQVMGMIRISELIQIGL